VLVDCKDVRPPKIPPARYLQCIARTAALSAPRRTSILLAGLLLAACFGLLRAQAPVRGADECQADASSVDANQSPTALRVPTQPGSPDKSDLLPIDTARHLAVTSNRLQLDEARLMGILAREAGNAGALAGMGWIRSQQGNFLAAISFLEQARLKRPNDHALAVALDLDRFRFLLSEARYSLASNDLTAAQKRYLAALDIRPNSREASAGLNATRFRASADGPPTKPSWVLPPCAVVPRMSGLQPPNPSPVP